MEVAGFLRPGRSATAWCRRSHPRVLRRSADGLSREIPEARIWGAVLTAIPIALALLSGIADCRSVPARLVVAGLTRIRFVFAVISSLHSYLILAYAGSKKAAEDVGFYYAANAAGRLIGIVLSGALTQYGGLRHACGAGGDACRVPCADIPAAGRVSTSRGAC